MKQKSFEPVGIKSPETYPETKMIAANSPEKK
jgi:hypothetical protein